MKIKISTLRKIIREEVERNLRWSAGISSDGAKLNKPSKGINYGVPSGLGPDSGAEENEDKENETLDMKNKNRHQMMDDREDRMELIGKVVESLPGTLFEVKTSTGQTVLATLSGKMRQNHIMVLPGDDVIIEVSPYDTSRGRIMRRK